MLRIIFNIFVMIFVTSGFVGSTHSLAKEIECKRYSAGWNTFSNYSMHRDYNAWMPEILKIPIENFQVKPNSKSIFVYNEFQYTHSGSTVTRELRLFPDGKIIAKTRGSGKARYKCDMKPQEVLLAKTKSEDDLKLKPDLAAEKKAEEDGKRLADIVGPTHSLAKEIECKRYASNFSTYITAPSFPV